MSDPLQDVDPTDPGLFALYEHAHSDLWWAKTQEWNVANWALLLIAGVVGAARTILEGDLTPERTWGFALVIVLVGLAAGWYLGTLHAGIVHNRDVYRAIEKKVGIKTLRTKLPQAAGEESDKERGSEFLYVMCIGIGLTVALGFAVLKHFRARLQSSRV